MRLLRIFSIHFEDALQYRSTAFVWFLLALINPLMVLLFWRGAFASGTSQIAGWNFSTIASYYLMLVIANSLLMSHIEYEVAYKDIQQGMLSGYLLKPFHYSLNKFFNEFPWRLLEGAFALVALIIILIVFHVHIRIVTTPLFIILAICSAILGHILGFIYKIILGISAFWITDYSGLMELSDVLIVIFGGSVMPLILFPGIIKTVALASPFAYMTYYPIVAFLNQEPAEKLFLILLGQLVWIGLFYGLYRVLWTMGIKKFTGIGQ